MPFLIVRRSLLLVACLVLCLPTQAQLKVHSIFSSNMVLQRDKPIKVWGWAKSGAAVTVKLGQDQGQATADVEDGAWSVSFEPREASADPITLTVDAGSDSLTYENIVVGDVWVMNGQSNMAWPLGRTLEVDIQRTQADLPQLRLIKIVPNEQKELATDIPVDKIIDGGWRVSDPMTAKEISGIGFAFGSDLQRSLGIPIGIIDNARGGAAIESLVPERKLDEHPLTKRYYDYVKEREGEFSIDGWVAERVERWEKLVEKKRKQGVAEDELPLKPTAAEIRSWNIPGMSPSDAGSCYNGMFGAFIGFNIKGVVFHQGYNNSGSKNCRPERYRIIMKQMIEGWREDFNDPQLPVAVIGFCAGGNPQSERHFESESTAYGPFTRESQRLGLEDVGDPQYTAFLPAHDIQIPGLHPKKKKEHGERAARWALNRVYRAGVQWDSAKLVSSEVVDDMVVLTFDKPVYSHDMSALPEGFSIAGDDGAFYRAFARYRTRSEEAVLSAVGKDVDANVIYVWSPLVTKPVGVRYAWATSPLANLYVGGKPWAPLHSFRTDSFDLAESEDPAEAALSGIDWRDQKRQGIELNQDRLQREAEMAVQINQRLKTLGVAKP